MATLNTIIVSDVHLGSDVSRAGALLATLKTHDFKRLILLGDIFDDLNFRRLPREHWTVLSHIRDLTHPESGVEVVWVEGNHDEGLSEVTSHFIGVPVFQEYSWRWNGTSFLAIHGHQFDRFLVEHSAITEVATGAYKLLQKLDFKQHGVSRFAKRISKKWLRQSEKIARHAIDYGKQRGAEYVFCGHTHFAMQCADGGVRYVNSGCWTDVPSTFIAIDENGVEVREGA